MSELTCICEDFDVQIKKVNAPIVTQSARSGFRWQYDGKPFKFCPWCGTPLFEVAQAETAEKP